MLFPNVHNVIVIVSSLADMNLQSFDMVPYEICTNFAIPVN